MMTITNETVSAWLAAYIKAWQSYDPTSIRALFAEDATYAYNPWDEPLQGREAILRSWLDEPDAPESWSAHYEPLAVDGNIAVATGDTRYFAADGSVSKEFCNCYVIEFDSGGCATSFTEWYMQKPRA
jgi:ketosteroid isomerase-like protein